MLVNGDYQKEDYVVKCMCFNDKELTRTMCKNTIKIFKITVKEFLKEKLGIRFKGFLNFHPSKTKATDFTSNLTGAEYNRPEFYNVLCATERMLRDLLNRRRHYTDFKKHFEIPERD